LVQFVHHEENYSVESVGTQSPIPLILWA
jgi:hypothetical protein